MIRARRPGLVEEEQARVVDRGMEVVVDASRLAPGWFKHRLQLGGQRALRAGTGVKHGHDREWVSVHLLSSSEQWAR